MDEHIVKAPNTNTTPKLNTSLDHDLSLSTSAFFLSSNGLSHDDDDDDDDNQFEICDIAMITVESVSYTSLKDLLPLSPSSTAAITSPTNNSSWHEIPIKNPLVKQAALAYLQPMSSPPEVGGSRGFFGKFKDTVCCCCQCECFGWIHDVVLRSLRDEDDKKVD